MMNDMKEYYRDGIRSNGALTCPQCGAPITSEKCPYCGVVFFDFACIDTKQPFYMKIKHDDQVHIFKVRMDNVNVSFNTNTCQLYADNTPYQYISSQEAEINLTFHQVN